MSASTIRLARLAAPVTVLGPGRRVGVWVQGCTIGCAGCASVDTWDAAQGMECDVSDVVAQITSLADSVGATGLSITGGEPFQQADAVADLVRRARDAWPGDEAVDVLIFTGYTAKAARRRSAALWDEADIIVAGPYRHDRPGTHPLLASANQTLETRTALGVARLSAVDASRRAIQVSATSDELTLAGLPAPGDLERLRRALEDRGVHLEGVSWDAGPRETPTRVEIGADL